VIDYRGFIQKNFLIKNKLGEIVPFIFNETQSYYYNMMVKDYGKELQGVRENILKFRQPGFSSLIDGIFTTDFIYSEWAKIPITDADIVSHKQKDTIVLFNRVSFFLDSFFNKWDIDRKDYLETDTNVLLKGRRGAQIYVQTASAKVSGRGGTKQNIHWCLGEDTKIIRPDGSTTKIKDISIGDDVITEDGSITNVTNKWETGVKSIKKIRLWYGNETIDTSPEHKIRVATRHGNRFGKPEWKQAKDLTIKDYVLWAYPKTNAGLKYDYSFGYLLGYYLAEGHISKNLNRVTFTCHRDEDFYKNFSKIIDKEPLIQIEGNRKRIIYNFKKLGIELNELVGRVKDKHIPKEFLYSGTKDFLKGIYSGWKDGDGSKTEKYLVSITTIREKIARQMRQIYATINHKILGLDYYTDRKRYEVITKDIYRLREYQNKSDRLLKEVYTCPREVSDKNGYLYIRIKEITNQLPQNTYEIEVAHKSHAFLTVCGVVSNSEVAFYPNTEILNANTLVVGAEQQVPDNYGKIFRETTGNTDVDFFAEEYFRGLEGKSEFKSRFLGWWLHKAYSKKPPLDWIMPPDYKKIHNKYGATAAQCYWHWRKVQLSKDKQFFKREYPTDETEAFIGDGSQYFDVMITKQYAEFVKPAMKDNLIYV